ncbi:aromatic amino acid transport family protein [Shigella flexneri]
MTNRAEKKHSAFWGVMVIAGTVIGGGIYLFESCRSWFFFRCFYPYGTLVLNASFRVIVLQSKLNYPVAPVNTITKDLMVTPGTLSAVLPLPWFYILTYAYISANGAIISETISMNLGYHANPRIVESAQPF